MSADLALGLAVWLMAWVDWLFGWVWRVLA